VREALPETDLGELENIKTLPGMVRGFSYPPLDAGKVLLTIH
jgi:hypothetical protein